MLNKTLHGGLYQNLAQLWIHLAWVLIPAKTMALGFTYLHNAHSKRHLSFLDALPSCFFVIHG